MGLTIRGTIGVQRSHTRATCLAQVCMILCPQGREEDGRFADTVAENRRVKLKSFTDYEQAVAWLTAKKT